MLANDSCDTLLISIRELALNVDMESCSRTAEQGRHVTLRLIFDLTSTQHPNWFLFLAVATICSYVWTVRF